MGQQKKEDEEEDHSSNYSMGREKRARLDKTEDDEEVDEEKTLPAAVFDPVEGVFRCTVCLWEVIEGECAGCGAEHIVTEEMQEKDDEVRFDFFLLSSSFP